MPILQNGSLKLKREFPDAPIPDMTKLYNYVTRL